MREMARRSDVDRRDLFRAASQKMRVHEAIVEKDFWVCWILDCLFHESAWEDHLAFKGGTSLSKAYGAIERFSEDIDLVLDWRLLGYTREEPWSDRSATKQDAFVKEANQRTVEFLEREFAPALRDSLATRLGKAVAIACREQNVLIEYPRAFSLAAIQPQIRLEIGPMAAWVPNEQRSVRPYAAEQFAELFQQPDSTVRTIVAERTFWEKATILHQEAHRGPDKPLPPRYSRHYYDLCRLSRMPIRDSALADVSLLREVAGFKMRFYRCPWARYEDAKPGSLRLLPPEHHMTELRRDYAAMQAMLFGQVPKFDQIISEIAELERAVNGL
jgi:hypothetical protein